MNFFSSEPVPELERATLKVLEKLLEPHVTDDHKRVCRSDTGGILKIRAMHWCLCLTMVLDSGADIFR